MTTTKSTGKKKNSTNKIDSLKKENKKIKNELKEKNEKLLRSIADFQNLQKRNERELQQCREETKNRYLCELLDLKELLQKAYEDNNPKAGLKLMINNIENFFEKEEIKSINCIGEKFDHNLHHAVTTIEKKDCEDNTIIEEVKKGYTINNKLLRPAHVIVAKNKNKEN
jgi:molecular chaperone GrpE